MVAAADRNMRNSIHNFVLTNSQSRLATGSFPVGLEGKVEDKTGLWWP